jgi:hypothetical protein
MISSIRHSICCIGRDLVYSVGIETAAAAEEDDGRRLRTEFQEFLGLNFKRGQSSVILLRRLIALLFFIKGKNGKKKVNKKSLYIIMC